MSKVKAKENIRILLLQIRKHEAVAAEELASFARHAGLKQSQIDILNVFKKPIFDSSVIAGYDSLWVGGASEANVLQPDKYRFIESAKALLSYCCDQSIPVFASCFGFQIAVLALSGEIIDSDGEFELGTLPISLTKHAKLDTLFADTPDQFFAVSVHKQKAITAPPQTELLAFTNTCVHAFKVKDKPFWAFQFHPEVDRTILTERLSMYRDTYTGGSEQLEAVLKTAQETPESNLLMSKFVERVLCRV